MHFYIENWEQNYFFPKIVNEIAQKKEWGNGESGTEKSRVYLLDGASLFLTFFGQRFRFLYKN